MKDVLGQGPFPFSAIVGQEEMKRAMILTAIDGGIGGVLVFGDCGTSKSRLCVDWRRCCFRLRRLLAVL